MSYKYSLIVATFERKKELETLLVSLAGQTFKKSDFEIIIVDQNIGNLISEIVSRFSSQLNIKHIKSQRKGLSYNRNLGIKNATGVYIAVPDDDCEYYSDTLQTINNELQKFSYPDMIIGRVFNRREQKYVFKKVPDEIFYVQKGNFYKVVSSITIFFKKDTNTFFDENFGIGEKYHSNEDGELILNFLKQGKTIIYSPIIEFDHPPYNASNMSIEKLYKYGVGFGAMCRKYFSLSTTYLFVKVIAFQFIMVIKELLTFNFSEMRRRYHALKGRVVGFLIYKS
jgi:glycosyltransferase involved in cell wall biosynthesis